MACQAGQGPHCCRHFCRLERPTAEGPHGKNLAFTVKILDRYILKKFLRSFIFTLLLITSVITLIDFSEKNGYFIKYAVPYEELIEYYYAYMLFIINFITPVTVFITTVFITSRLAQRTEIIAVLSGGVSFFRFLVPYLVGASLISFGSFVLTGWALAKANKTRLGFETEYNMQTVFRGRSQHLHIRIAPQRYFYVRHYRAYNHSGTNVIIETVKGHELIERLSAQRIQWLAAEEKWQLQDWMCRKIDGFQEHITQGSTLDLVIDLHPDDFSINPKLHETLTLPELNAHIASLQSKGADNVHFFLTEKYVRYMSPFAAIILTFMGVVVASRKARGGVGLQIAIGFILALIYVACFLFAKGIAEAKGTHLLLTIWTPNIIFSILGVVMYRLVPK